jgi:hypothetical protein
MWFQLLILQRKYPHTGDLLDSRASFEEDVNVVSKFQQLATVFENKDFQWTPLLGSLYTKSFGQSHSLIIHIRVPYIGKFTLERNHAAAAIAQSPFLCLGIWSIIWQFTLVIKDHSAAPSANSFLIFLRNCEITWKFSLAWNWFVKKTWSRKSRGTVSLSDINKLAR